MAQGSLLKAACPQDRGERKAGPASEAGSRHFFLAGSGWARGRKKKKRGKGLGGKEVAARLRGDGQPAVEEGWALRRGARATVGVGNRGKPGRRRGGEDRGCGWPVPWQDFPCRGRLWRDRTFPKGSGLRLCSSRPACRGRQCACSSKAGPASANYACAKQRAEGSKEPPLSTQHGAGQ